LATTSDVEPVRLTPAAGVPAGIHGTYRGRAGSTIAVLTFSALPPLPAGEAYQAWALHGDRWDSLGLVRLDSSGTARLIVESPAVAVPPDALQVTREPAAGRAAPTG